MLRELTKVPQIPGERMRRWFSSRSLDLIVWYDDPQTPSGFQLCYRSGGREKAFTWHAPSTYTHMSIDDGESRPFRHKGAPVLVPDGPFEPGPVIAQLRQQSGEVPDDVLALVVRIASDPSGALQ